MSKHTTEKERHFIEVWLKERKSVAWIAEQLEKNRSTIYREIKRGETVQLTSLLERKVVYLSDRAQMEYNKKQKNKGAKEKLSKDDAFLLAMKEKILKEKYSPEAFLCIVPDKKVCVKTLYNYVHKGYIDGLEIENLPYAKRKRKKKEKEGKQKYTKGTSIEDRPKFINTRNSYGHWEMDTVYSSKDDLTCLLVLSERAGRTEKVIQIKDRTASSVIRALNRLERSMGTVAFRETFKTITCDNGKEFSRWEDMEKSCINKGKRTKVYFCHPYTSCERGTNENINRMIRRWIPKGDDIGLYSKAEVQQIEDWINSYPRQIFGGLSSKQYTEMVLCP